MPTSETIRVAAAQFFSGTDPVENLELCRSYLRRAAAVGARLVVLPENSNRVRDYTDRQDCFEHSEALTGPFVVGLAETCEELGIFVAVGVDLRGETAPDVFISSILFGPDGGIRHVHRKHTLWDYEYSLFSPGDEPYRVVDTEIGRIGLQICADGIVPDTPRMLALLGAQILCNSLNSRGPDEPRVHVPLRAIENHVWHISANTVGGPSDQWPWMGGSQIVAPDGTVLAAAGEHETEFISAEIVPADADHKTTTFTADLFGWRRPELYGDLALPVDEVPAAGMYGPADDLPTRPMKVALCQVSWNHSDEWTRSRIAAQVAYAAQRGARVVVLPELAHFREGSVADDPHAAAEQSAEVLTELRALTAQHGIWSVVSLVEGAGGRYFSTAYLLDDEGGVAATYRKTHLDDTERTWASEGDDLPIFSTRVGRVGLMLGNEVWAPEVMRVLAVRGAEIVFHPCSWDRSEAADVAACERTEENRVYLASVTRIDAVGRRGSQVMRPDPFEPGQPIAVMRFPTGYWTRGGFEEQLIVDVDLRESNDKMMGNYLDPLRMRQPALYGAMVQRQVVPSRVTDERIDGVLVAGAGPVGLSAAAVLAQRGVAVTVLEAGSGLSAESRASTFHPPSLELLDSIGAYGPLADGGLRVPTFQYRSRTEGLVAEFDLGILAPLTPFPFRIQREQSQLTPILRDLVDATGHGEIRFGHRVLCAGQDGDDAWVDVETSGERRRLRADHVIAADGAGSVVRRSLGVEFDGTSYEDRFQVVSTDFPIENAIPGIAWVNYVSDPEEWVVLLRTPSQWRVLTPAPQDRFDRQPAEVEVRALLGRVIPGGEHASIMAISGYPVHQRVASTFHLGRFLLAGDAAHVNSPIGGMGMNSGIADAFAFADALAKVERGSSDLLIGSAAQQRRRFALEYVQIATKRNTANLALKDPAVAARQHAELRAIAGDPQKALTYLAASCLISDRLDRAESEIH